jgi:hypothetical protein
MAAATSTGRVPRGSSSSKPGQFFGEHFGELFG